MALRNVYCNPGAGAKALNRLPELASPLLHFNMRN